MGLPEDIQVVSNEYFRKKFTLKVVDETYYGKDLFGRQIFQTRNQYLTDNLIIDAVEGNRNIGAYNRYFTRMICLDIDTYSKHNESIPDDVIKRYYRLVNEIGVEPSAVFQSTNYGLHCYFLLTQSFPISFILFQFQKFIKGVDKVEILPTHNHSLRILRRNYQLCVETLEPKITKWKDFYRYHPIEIFWRGYTRLYLRSHFKRTGRDDHSNIQTEKQITEFESKFYPIRNKQSNDPVCKIAGYHYFQGLTVETSTLRITTLLLRSNYTNELLDYDKLRYKIENIYKGCREKRFTFYEQISDLDLFDKQVIENIVSQSPFYKQREQSLRKYLIQMFNYINYHTQIKKSRVDFDFYCAVYGSDYRTFRNQGLFPLPSVMLKAWNGHYRSIMDYLIEIGVLVVSKEYWYGGELDEYNRCRYYKVNKIIEIKKWDRETRRIELSKLVKRLGRDKVLEELNIKRLTLYRWLEGKTDIRKDRRPAVDNLIRLYDQT